MMQIFKVSVFSLLLLSLLHASQSRACTIFTATKDDKVLFAANEDQPRNNSYMVVDKEGPLGILYFATDSRKYDWLEMQMGINEKGLMYDLNWIPEEDLIPEPNKIVQDKVWAVTKAMQTSSTIDEVIEIIFAHNWGSSIAYQLHFADRHGDAVVIHPDGNGRLTHTRMDKKKGYLVSSNYNPAKQSIIRFGKKRQQTAEALLSELPTRSLTPEYMSEVLEATHQNNRFFNNPKTLFSAVFDPNAMQVFVYFARDFDNPAVLDIKEELDRVEKREQITLPQLLLQRK